MKKRSDKMTDELRPEHDLRQLLKAGVRGKYAKRYGAGTNLILLDPDIRKAFRSERAVNEALRVVSSALARTLPPLLSRNDPGSLNGALRLTGTAMMIHDACAPEKTLLDLSSLVPTQCEGRATPARLQ